MRDARLASLQNGIAPRTDLRCNGAKHTQTDHHEGSKGTKTTESFLYKNAFVNFETFESS
jgi:hypothetical protein